MNSSEIGSSSLVPSSGSSEVSTFGSFLGLGLGVAFIFLIGIFFIGEDSGVLRSFAGKRNHESARSFGWGPIGMRTSFLGRRSNGAERLAVVHSATKLLRLVEHGAKLMLKRVCRAAAIKRCHHVVLLARNRRVVQRHEQDSYRFQREGLLPTGHLAF